MKNKLFFKSMVAGGLVGVASITGVALIISKPAQAQTAFSAPPFAEPSAYYVLPHYPLTVTGTYFTPGERVTVRQVNRSTGNRTTIAAGFADTNGGFFRNITPANPYVYASTTQTYVVEGEDSNYPVFFSVVFGTYYPQITPSTYLAIGGQKISVTGYGFAPNEPVLIYGNNDLLMTTYAGVNGVIGITIRTPSSGKTYTVSAQGGWSQKISARTITLMQ